MSPSFHSFLLYLRQDTLRFIRLQHMHRSAHGVWFRRQEQNRVAPSTLCVDTEERARLSGEKEA